MDKTKQLESKLPSLYKDNSCDHNIGHIKRVVRDASIIGKREGADLSILLPAAMLHDIALKKGTLTRTNDRHAVLGANIAEKILRDIGFDNDKIKAICSTIMQHSLDSPTNEPRTLEGDCLFDADKLDAMKPNGVARYMQECALVKNMGPEQTAEKYIKVVKPFKFRTKTGKIMGKDRKDALRFCEMIINSGKV